MSQKAKKEAGRQGGLARRGVLSSKELKGQAQRAAAARWGKPLIATNKGNFLEEFGVNVDCYVLGDATRTAVISQRGVARVLGLSDRGSALPSFLASRGMAESLGIELGEKIKNPLKFQWGSGGSESPPSTINGHDATVLIDLCKAIIQADADGKLVDRQKKVAQQAAIIVGASAKSGIKHLVWSLAGYNPTADEVIQSFKLYVLEEAKKYEKEFPPELYGEWQRLYQIAPIQGRGKPWEFMHLTVNHIYIPLAKSNGKILELLRALKSKDGDRRMKLFQFLNDVGSRALRMQIGRVLEMAEDSNTKIEYESRIKRRFGGQQEFDFTPPPTQDVT